MAVKHIFIAQDSLYLSAIASLLRQDPALTISFVTDAPQSFQLAPPDVILVDQANGLAGTLEFMQAYPNTPILTLDGLAHTATMLAGKRAQIESLQDLLKLLE